jgi:hypothetical protein
MEIEFKNLETLEYFKPMIQELESEEKTETDRLKRLLVLLRAGLWSPDL